MAPCPSIGAVSQPASEGIGAKPVDLCAGQSLDALVQQFPAPARDEVADLRETLIVASDCLFAARREIQRSVRTPVSLHDISVLSDLLMRVTDFLAADGIITALGRPVSGQELADTGYRLLDITNEYCILAQHFYSDEVKAARARRPSDVAEAEIAAVACKATSLKLGVMRYVKNVGEALQAITARVAEPSVEHG